MLDWMDVTQLSSNRFLLLERVQLNWLPGWLNFSGNRLELL